MPDRYAVLGNPIAHSRSPQIHTAFARQTAQDMTYGAILVEPGALEETIQTFQSQGGKGLNITLPYKHAAWQLVPQCSPRAQRARAINTVTMTEDGSLTGENTDGTGLVRDLLQNHGGQIAGQRVLLLGAGGAASGVMEALLAERPAILVIANRTPAKAADLAARHDSFGTVLGGGYELLEDRSFHLVINATASSLQGEVPPLPEDILCPGGWLYDMVYSHEPTAFMQWGRRQGAARALDGLGMLLEQAAEAFFLWRGIRPRTAPLFSRLREEMTQAWR